MFFFQTPLADLVVGMNDLAFIDRLWADWSPGYDATEDLKAVKESLRDPANLAAALGYYRSMFAAGDDALAAEQASVQAPCPQPTLYLHGGGDGCIGVEVGARAAQFLGPGSLVEVLPDAGHFLHLERPEEVAKLVLGFLES
jgi:pimeloyl-ACP methyl ester carboxylesterase